MVMRTIGCGALTRSGLRWALPLAIVMSGACSEDKAAGGDDDDDGLGASDSGAMAGLDNAAFLEGDGVGCDLTGSWATRGVTFTTAESALAPGPQKTSAWALIEIEQDGDDFTVVSDLPCGIMTTGDATINMRGPGGEFAPPMYQQKTKTDGRLGTSVDDGEQCQVTFERLYGALGTTAGDVEPPGRIDGNPELSSFEPLTADDAEDWDEDGDPGITFIVTDTVAGSGTRFAIQRSWAQLSGPVPYGPGDFLMPIEWDFDDLVIGASSPLFEVEAVVRMAPHMALYRRVDADMIIGADDEETCDTLRELMPHAVEPAEEF